jgi:hypothetical protein
MGRQHPGISRELVVEQHARLHLPAQKCGRWRREEEKTQQYQYIGCGRAPTQISTLMFLSRSGEHEVSWETL